MGKINFDTLPGTKPSMGNVIPKGNYLATVVTAEMKQPKDETKPEYFNAECDITDTISNTPMGKFWIRLFESEAPLPQYQLRRFIEAIGLQITGEFELKDLTKIVKGAQLRVDLMPEERKDGNFSGFKVKVNKADMGNLIGKQGRMAQSIRNVMKAVATKEHKKVSIEFTEK